MSCVQLYIHCMCQCITPGKLAMYTCTGGCSQSGMLFRHTLWTQIAVNKTRCKMQHKVHMAAGSE